VVRLAPAATSGVVAGLSWTQLALVLVAGVPALIGFISQDIGPAMRVLLLWTVPVGAFAVARWNGRTAVERAQVAGGFFWRRMRGRTRAATHPEAAHRVARGDVERRISRLNVPGAVGERMKVVEMVGTRYEGAAFLWDRAEGTASAVVRRRTDGWGMDDTEDKIARVQAVNRLVGHLATLDGVARVALHARTYPHPTPMPEPATIGGGHLQAWDAALAVTRADLADVVGSPMLAGALARDVLMVVTVKRDQVKAEVRANGGGRAGMSAVLANRVRSIITDLPAAGVIAQGSRWLSPGQVRAAVRLALDPEAGAVLATGNGHVSDRAVLAALTLEHFDHVATDSACHRTWWLEAFPGGGAPAGLLAPLIEGGNYPHTVTQVWWPVSLSASERALNQQSSAVDSVVKLSQRLGRDTSAGTRREVTEIAERRKEMEEGYGDVRYSVAVTASAPSEDELKTVGELVRQALPGVQLRQMNGQQWAAFVSTALPLGIGRRG